MMWHTGPLYSYKVARPHAPITRSKPLCACVYCGALATDLEKLTNEHVIPDGIGGNLILTAGSCRSCAMKTNRFESETINRCFGVGKKFFGIKSKKRRGKNSRPQKSQVRYFDYCLPDHVEPDDDDEYLKSLGLRGAVDLEISKPTSGLFVFLGYRDLCPGVLVGASITSFPFEIEQVFRSTDDDEGVSFSAYVDPVAFFLSIMKIAHCFACGTIGIGNFKPCVPSFILGVTPPAFIPFVLGTMNPVNVTEELHSLTLYRAQGESNGVSNLELFVVRVQLFGNMKGTIYDVVVGSAPNTYDVSDFYSHIHKLIF